MRMTSALRESAPGETEVSVVSEVSVTGILAQLGRGMMQDVSDQMLRQFTDAMRAQLEKPSASGALGPDATSASPPETPASASAAEVPAPPPQVSPPIQVVSFGSRIAARAAGRAVRRPLFWVVVVLAGLAVFWLSRR